MRRATDDLRGREFDVLVVGGGISGACIAHDAALRGLSVALVEKRDFGGATSASSSKLLHSGIRFLQHGQVGRLRESAIERGYFHRIAPHQTRFVSFLIPTYPGLMTGRLFLDAGLMLYRLLAVGSDGMSRDPAKRAPRSRYCSRAELQRLAPALAGDPTVTGAHVLPESHMHSSERMTLAFVKTASANGAAVCNYVSVDAFLTKDRRVIGATVRDEATGERFEIASRVLVNATGPWIPQLNRLVGAGSLHRDITDYAKGVHIVTRSLGGDYGVVVPTKLEIDSTINRGGRHLFAIPWRGHTLIGTTNSPFRGSVDDVEVTTEDIEELLFEINRALPGARLTHDDIVHAYAGLFSLTTKDVRPGVYQVTPEYQAVDHSHAGAVDGAVSALGAKYTTARRLAERTVDLVFRKLGRRSPLCATGTTPLVGGAIESLDDFRADVRRRHGGTMDEATLEHLVASYGAELDDVLAAGNQNGGLRAKLALGRESIEAEVAFAVTHEMAVHLDDVVFRRTGLGTLGHPGRKCLERCAHLMATALGWNAAQATQEIRRTEQLFNRLPMTTYA